MIVEPIQLAIFFAGYLIFVGRDQEVTDGCFATMENKYMDE